MTTLFLLIRLFSIGVFTILVADTALTAGRRLLRWRRSRRDFPAATARAIRRDRRASRLNLDSVNRNFRR